LSGECKVSHTEMLLRDTATTYLLLPFSINRLAALVGPSVEYDMLLIQSDEGTSGCLRSFHHRSIG
jgi:hypothetical protein